MNKKPTKTTRSVPEEKKSTSLNNKSGGTVQSLGIPSQPSRGSSAAGVDIANKLKGMMGQAEDAREA